MTQEKKSRGKLLESVPLQSERCSVLLQQALEVAEQEERSTNSKSNNQHNWSQRTTTLQTRYASSSSDEEESLSESSSSSASSSSKEEKARLAVLDEEAQEGDTLVDEDAGGDKTLSTPTNNERNKANTKKKKYHPTLDQRQKQALIQKHVDQLQCVQLKLPLSDESESNGKNYRVLELASCLLSKEDLLGSTIDNHETSSAALRQCRAYLELSSTKTTTTSTIIVLSLQSGRFAGAVFSSQNNNQCLDHTTSTRYTVRRGQGKSQSSQDAQRRAKSIGAQLRRQGEVSLQTDVQTTLTLWKPHLKNAQLIFIAAPKTMKKTFFFDDALLARDDARIRRVPLHLGRPSFESVSLIHAILTTVSVREYSFDKEVVVESAEVETLNSAVENVEQTVEQEKTKEEAEIIPLTALHWAAQHGDLEAIQLILESLDTPAATMTEASPAAAAIDSVAGELFMTPLHYAAESSSSSEGMVDPSVAAACVRELLEHGHANPCLVDARNRVPYFLAHHEVVRNGFRIARGNLGEDYCRWDEGAKVGPALTQDAIEEKKEKEAEKKRKKRARQKANKAKEKAEAKRMEEERLAQEQREKEEEDAKRVRDGLQPKAAGGIGTSCDFCQKVCKGRQRAQMFKRLDYSYCSTECVQKHKRELMASAAAARFDRG